ncbi:MAG: AMP-binding protein [Treponema sp.]|jgi:long-chain acyl-CoA synthetase|nr:AMP-binding protein [Treponema sp.]
MMHSNNEPSNKELDQSFSTVIELLHGGAEHWGDDPYLGNKQGDRWRRYSFKETDRLSSALALSLIKLGFKRYENISILAEGRASWVIGEFALLKAGYVSVPLSTKLLPDELLFRLDHSESRALLVSENNFQKGAEVLGRVKVKPVLICISPKNEHTEDLVKKFALSPEQNFYYYDDLLDRGEKLLDAKEGEGAELVKKLAEIEKSITTDDTVTICYTSGTTGNPKGIMLSHRNYLHNAKNAAQVVRVKPGWKNLIMLPLDHSFAHTVGLYVFLFWGLTMYFPDSQGGPLAALRNLSKNLSEVNPDFLLTVPALSGNFMKKMIQGVRAKGPLVYGIFERGLKAGIKRAGNGYNKTPLGTRILNYLPWALAEALVFPKLRSFFGTDIKFCIGGGALLEIKQQEFFNAIGAPVYQGYGLTENSPIICANSVEKHKFGTSGVIIPDLDVRIMKDENTEARTGEAGQIVTRGGSVMKGYYKNPEATAETLRDGWLWSGDLGYKDGDGFLVVTGREKALLIAEDGEKYSPETIEEAVINSSRLVNQIMAYNEQCKFTSALITVNVEELKAAAGALGIAGTPGAGLPGSGPSDADLDKLITLIQGDLWAFKRVKEYAAIPAQWQPASFAIIAAPFDENNGLVNSTMKLVRHKVRDFYRSRIDELYAVPSADPLLPGNRAALRELLK